MFVLLPGEGEGVVEVELLLPRVQPREVHHLRLQLDELRVAGASAAGVGVGVTVGAAEHALGALAVVLALGAVHFRLGLGIGIGFGLGVFGSGCAAVAGGTGADGTVVDELVVERVRGGGGEAAEEGKGGFDEQRESGHS